jgi:uncharacterized protein YndB with AHSA1/START domain
MADVDSARGQPLLVMTRVVAAPRPTVFEAWARPERLARWWDPAGAPAARAIERADPRAVAAYRIPLRNAAGAAYHIELAIRELVHPERIVFTWGRDAQSLTLVELTLTDAAGPSGRGTRLAFEQSVLPRITRPWVGAAYWEERLARLQAYLSDCAA